MMDYLGLFTQTKDHSTWEMNTQIMWSFTGFQTVTIIIVYYLYTICPDCFRRLYNPSLVIDFTKIKTIDVLYLINDR